MVGNKRRRTNGGFDTSRHETHSEVSTPAVSQPTFLTTFDRKSHYPVFSALCDCLSIAEIVSLTQTCKMLSDLYQYLLPIQWDVDKALRHYVDDPQGFRSQMARSDALISGTFAAQFFGKVFWDCGPLDVMVQEGVGCELFSKYLSDVADYSEVDLKEDNGGVYKCIYLGKVRVHAVVSVRVFILNHYALLQPRIFTRDTDGKVAIRLHSASQPVQNIVIGTYFTAEVNIISWNKAYSVFPLPTFILKTCYLLQSWDERTANSAQVLSRRGLNVQGVMWPEDNRRNHPIRRRRRIGDRFTWTIPFDTREVRTSKTPDYVLEYACFEVYGLATDFVDIEYHDDENGGVRNYTVWMEMLDSKVLKYRYTYGDDDMRDFFMARLHASTIIELHKLNAAERPTRYREILHNTRDIDLDLRDFNRPASWTYRDDDIPKWYKAFEKHNPELVDSEQMAI